MFDFLAVFEGDFSQAGVKIGTEASGSLCNINILEAIDINSASLQTTKLHKTKVQDNNQLINFQLFNWKLILLQPNLQHKKIRYLFLPSKFLPHPMHSPRPFVTISLTDSIVKFDTVSKFGPMFPSDPAAFSI